MAITFTPTKSIRGQPFSLSGTTDDISVAAFVMNDHVPDAVSGYTQAFGIAGSTVEAEIKFGWDGTNSTFQQAWNCRDAGNLAFKYTTALQADTWYHVGLSMDSSASTNNVEIYLDGTSETPATNDLGDLANDPQDRFFVGAGSWFSGNPYDGSVCEVAVWNAVLTQTEFQILAAGISPLLVRPNALVCYWPGVNTNTSTIELLGANLTETGAGSIANIGHPSVFRPTSQILQFPPAAAPAAASYFPLRVRR